MIKTTLYCNNKIEIRKSKIHGWGVFAKENINKREILEEVPFLILPVNNTYNSTLLIDYRFNYPKINPINQVLPLGFGPLYNHSDNPNSHWYIDEESQIFIFESLRFINKDNEILVYYGGSNYWNDGRKNTKVIS